MLKEFCKAGASLNDLFKTRKYNVKQELLICFFAFLGKKNI